MALLWIRSIIVETAGLTITEPKIDIDIRREISDTPIIGSVGIYNLNPEHERQIYERGRNLTLHAGHADDPSLIFQGAVQKIERERRDLRRVTRLALGGDGVAADVLGGYTETNFTGEVPLRTIATALVDDLNESSGEDRTFRLGPLDAIPEDATATWTGHYGRVDTALGVLTKRLPGLSWYEEDGVIHFSRVDVVSPAASEHVLNTETGLLESPTVTDDGVRVVTLLMPRIQLQDCVRIESDVLEGVGKVVSLVHAGDNWTGKMTTELELRLLPQPELPPPVTPIAGPS